MINLEIELTIDKRLSHEEIAGVEAKMTEMLGGDSSGYIELTESNATNVDGDSVRYSLKIIGR